MAGTSVSSTPLLGAGGEEWRNFEQVEGCDPNRWAAAVQTAAGRIDRLRRRDVALVLRDRRGSPLANREVRIEQTGSDFAWGICGWSHLRQLEEGEFNHQENVHIHQLQLGYCNAINLMHYWAERHCTHAPQSEEYQGHVNYDVLERGVHWARGEGLKCKGHPIYWPVPKAIPAWLLKYDVATRRKFLEVRVRQLTARLKGKMHWYDAVNEMMWEATLADVEQRHWPHLSAIESIADEAADVLKWAREEDPDACFLLNEYGIVKGETQPLEVASNLGTRISREQQLDRYIALGRSLVARGQAPDALGLQNGPGNWNDLSRLADTLDAIGEGTGLPVHITEFRTGTGHLEKLGLPAQEIAERLAEFFAAVLTISFGNEHMEGFWFWGEPGFYNGRKPTVVYQRVQKLIRDHWMTRETLRTDHEGRLRFRGFTGDYALRLERSSGQRSGTRFVLPRTCRGTLSQDMVLDLVE